MSETAPERTPPGRRENVFTRKIGPLPMWGWVAIIGGGILAWAFYKSKTSGAAAGTGTDATGADASQIPQFVNQTYVSTTPPVATPPPPVPTVGGPPPGGPHPPHPPPRTPPPRPPTVQPPGGQQTRTERLKHKGNIDQIAKRNHVDIEDLLEANPELAKYRGTGHLFPVGTTIRIPPAAA